MSAVTIVLDNHFLAQVEDSGRWEERFDVLVGELCQEYGPCFLWSAGSAFDVDIIFLIYPPGHHERMVRDRVLESYVLQNSTRVTHVYVIVIGRNSKKVNVQAADVVNIVNAQCIPHGVRAGSLRALRPEDLDDEVRKILVRLYTRRQRGAPNAPVNSPLSESSDVTNPGYALRPAYESSDL